MKNKDIVNELKEIKSKMRNMGYVINRIIKELEK